VGARFLHLACQGGRPAPLSPVRHAAGVEEHAENAVGFCKERDILE